MIIWGSKGKEKTVAKGQFLCPRCRTLRPYEHKKIAKYFTLYFIPLFQTENLGEYIECQVCRTPFRTEVLEQGQSIEREFQVQEQAAEAVKLLSDQLESGLPLHLVASSLKSAGIDEKAAAAALYAATGGGIKTCQNCGLAYTATLQYCSACGQALSSQSPSS